MLKQSILALALVSALPLPALAHHGWSWAEDEQTELTGVITSVEISPPHPVLTVDVEGESWTVELGNPNQTERSGFGEGSASVGDDVTALGHRANTEGETRFKAVRITIGDEVYDIYPDRIQ